jgi:hypothetical protein
VKPSGHDGGVGWAGRDGEHGAVAACEPLAALRDGGQHGPRDIERRRRGGAAPGGGGGGGIIGAGRLLNRVGDNVGDDAGGAGGLGVGGGEGGGGHNDGGGGQCRVLLLFLLLLLLLQLLLTLLLSLLISARGRRREQDEGQDEEEEEELLAAAVARRGGGGHCVRVLVTRVTGACEGKKGLFSRRGSVHARTARCDDGAVPESKCMVHWVTLSAGGDRGLGGGRKGARGTEEATKREPRYKAPPLQPTRMLSPARRKH